MRESNIKLSQNKFYSVCLACTLSAYHQLFLVASTSTLGAGHAINRIGTAEAVNRSNRKFCNRFVCGRSLAAYKPIAKFPIAAIEVAASATPIIAGASGPVTPPATTPIVVQALRAHPIALFSPPPSG